MLWPWHHCVYNKLSTDRSTHMFTGYFWIVVLLATGGTYMMQVMMQIMPGI